MFDFLTYPFMIRALIIGVTMAISTGLISNYLVSSNQSMIGDGLSHISFTGVVIGFLFSNQPLFLAVPISILSAILIKYLMRSNRLNGDTAIGLVSTFALAIGFIIISKSPGFNRSVEAMLVGSIFSTSTLDLFVSLGVMILTSIFITLGYKRLFSITYDATYAQFSKINVAFYDYMLAIITAIVVVVGVQTIGTLLITAFIVFPSVSSNLISKSFKQMLIGSIIINILVSVFGIISAHFLDFPAGATIIILQGLTFMTLYLYKRIRRIE